MVLHSKYAWIVWIECKYMILSKLLRKPSDTAVKKKMKEHVFLLHVITNPPQPLAVAGYNLQFDWLASS